MAGRQPSGGCPTYKKADSRALSFLPHHSPASKKLDSLSVHPPIPLIHHVSGTRRPRSQRRSTLTFRHRRPHTGECLCGQTTISVASSHDSQVGFTRRRQASGRTLTRFGPTPRSCYRISPFVHPPEDRLPLRRLPEDFGQQQLDQHPRAHLGRHRECRASRGSSSRRNRANPTRVAKIKGAVKEYNSKAASGNTVTRVFCGNCGAAFGHKVRRAPPATVPSPPCSCLPRSVRGLRRQDGSPDWNDAGLRRCAFCRRAVHEGAVHRPGAHRRRRPEPHHVGCVEIYKHGLVILQPCERANERPGPWVHTGSAPPARVAKSR